jgi:MFS family permease
MARKAYMHVVVAATFGALATMGVSAWVPAFYMRVHHIPSDRVSLWLTLGLIFGSFPGMLGGGWLCTRFYRPDGSTLLRVMGVAFIAAPVMGSIVFLERNATLALILYPPLSFSMSLWLAPYYAAQQELAGRQSRAAASAFGLILYNLIGAGLGPVAVGLISDRLSRHVGTDSLRYALALNLFVCFMALLHLRLARRSMAADLAAANER